MTISDKAGQIDELAAMPSMAPIEEGVSQLSTIKATIAGILGNGSDTDQLFSAVDHAADLFAKIGEAYQVFSSLVKAKADYHRSR